MKKHIHLLSILPIVTSIGIVSSCSCTTNPGYVAIPTDYLNIVGNTLDGFKADKLEEGSALANYDTLQIPSNIEIVKGFNYKKGYSSFNAIKTILGDNNGKWTTLEANSFSSMPELTKVVFPKTLKTIGSKVFNGKNKINRFDFSNVDVSILNNDQFYTVSSSYVITNGTIIVKSEDDKTTLTNLFKDNIWLKDWNYQIKNSK